MSKLILFLAAALVFQFAWAETTPNVKVSVTLNPAGDFVAETENITGKAVLNENGTIEATNIKVDVKSLHSGISLRDQHMINKYLEAGKYPEVILKVGKGSANKGEAILVVRGKEAKVSGVYSTNSQFLKAEFKLKLSEFGISEINYKGIGVDDEVKIVAIVPLIKKAAAAPVPAKPAPKKAVPAKPAVAPKAPTGAQPPPPPKKK